MKPFFYIIRHKDQDLWLSHKGAEKWTANRKNIHVGKARSEAEAWEYVKTKIQPQYPVPLVIEAWP